jgi:hypothetical protein
VDIFKSEREFIMAHAVITLTNGVEVKNAPVGFSWTTFFWGPFPALMRGDWKWGVILLIGAALTSGFTSIIAGFVYNKFYIKDMLAKGYKVNSMPPNVTDDTLKAYLGTVEIPHTAVAA